MLSPAFVSFPYPWHIECIYSLLMVPLHLPLPTLEEPLYLCTSHPRKVSASLHSPAAACAVPPRLFSACYLLHWVSPLLSFLLALICSFLPLQLGRAPRIFFSGKHNPHLLLQHCHQDRKWSKGRGQVKSSFSLSFPICPSTHTLDFLHKTWKGSLQTLTLIFYMVGFFSLQN